MHTPHDPNNKLKEMKKFMEKKILLVDDDKFIRDTFVERLRNSKSVLLRTVKMQ
jgi:hypothetical protein